MADEIDFDGYSLVNTGGISLPITTVLATLQPILSDTCVVLVTAATQDSNGVIAVPLPLASLNLGKFLILKNDHPLLPFEAVGFGSVSPGDVIYIISDGSSWMDITPSAGAL